MTFAQKVAAIITKCKAWEATVAKSAPTAAASAEAVLEALIAEDAKLPPELQQFTATELVAAKAFLPVLSFIASL